MESKTLWSTVDGTCISSKENHIAPVSTSIDPGEIDLKFQSVNNDPNYMVQQPLRISESTTIPPLTAHAVQQLLQTQKRSALDQAD